MNSKSKKQGKAQRSVKPVLTAKSSARSKTPRMGKRSRLPRKIPAGSHSKPSTPNLEKDRAEILAVSKRWWDANRQFSIPMMCEAFVGGDRFHGFNLNGHTYYGIDEWVKLWQYLGHVMAPTADAAAMAEPRDVKLMIRGDMAFLTAESTLTVKVLPTSDAESAALPPPGQTASIPFRATEVFVREDHEGNPVWKMWHFHCSPRAPEHERRMGF